MDTSATDEAVVSQRQTRRRRNVIVLGVAVILVVGAAVGIGALRTSNSGTAGAFGSNGQQCPDFNPFTQGPSPLPEPGQDWSGCSLNNFVLTGLSMTGVTMTDVIYSNTTCPNGTNSNARNPASCAGQGGGL